MAAMRWYTPAAVTPPKRSMNQRAQAVSLYLSGMPVNTSTVKLVNTRKCIQRWKTLNRRYSMRVRTCFSGVVALAGMASGVEAIFESSVDVQARMHEAECEHDADEDQVEEVEAPHPDGGPGATGVHVHQEPGEVAIRARVALGARAHDVLVRDGARRVGGREDLVAAVAVGANGGAEATEVEGLAVVAVEVGLLGFRMAARAQHALALAEGDRARSEDVVRRVAVGADRRLAVGVPEHQVPVEGAPVHGELVRVALAACRELRRHEPAGGLTRVVDPRLEAQVTAGAGELTVARSIVHDAVDVGALLLAADRDRRRLAAHPVAAEAGVVGDAVERRLGRGDSRRRAGGGRAGEAEHGRGGEHEHERQQAARHGVMPLCLWQASHI